MSARRTKQTLTHFSNGLGVATLVFLGLMLLNLASDRLGMAWIGCLLITLFLGLIWGVMNMVGRVAGFGTVSHYEEHKAQRIAEYERQNGRSAVGWQIPWFGRRKLGCDIHGLFMEESDGSRRRDI